MIQHGIVLGKALHGIYATWVTHTYLRVLPSLLHEWCTKSFASRVYQLPFVSLRSLHWLWFAACSWQNFLFWSGFQTCTLLYIHVLKMFLKFEFSIKCVSPLPSLGWKLVTWMVRVHVIPIPLAIHPRKRQTHRCDPELFMATLVKGMIFLCRI